MQPMAGRDGSVRAGSKGERRYVERKWVNREFNAEMKMFMMSWCGRETAIGREDVKMERIGTVR